MRSINFFILSLIPFLSLSHAIEIGIQKDLINGDTPIQSYSGRITFNEDSKNEDGLYPPQFMIGEKLVKLGVLAYDEMLKIHDSLPLATSQCPRAMVILASGKDIFFASSMKGSYRAYYESLLPENPLKIVLANCQTIGENAHRTGLGCGEPNVLDVALSSNAELDPSNTRITTWLTPSTRGNEINAPPCGKGSAGYGCAKIVSEFELKPFSGKIPDPGDGSEWNKKFEKGYNPRTACRS